VKAHNAPINTLKPHPHNARIGNVDAIAASLHAHGQYAPIVTRPDGTILAGHHVTQAAKQLGWTTIAAVVIDCTDQQATRILLADNRTSDLGGWHHDTLHELLTTLPDLTGTGYGQADIDELNTLINTDQPHPDPTPPPDDPTPQPVKIRCGPTLTLTVEPDAWDAWHDTTIGPMKKADATAHLKTLLDIPPTHRPNPTPQPTPDTTMETINVHHITPHPTNPRDGDVGAVTESLRTLGQYRPITVNKRTSRIVKGNHTYLAARALGWTDIAVHYIDVDETTETRILLADNRTSDLATYDPTRLGQLLTRTDLTGTGYDPEDVNDILTGKRTRPGPPPTGHTSHKIGPYGWRTPTDTHRTWAHNLTTLDIIHRLGLPENACTT
jgi:hypothetical protein